MLLRTLMEDKQLDFNQPLLSVRRFPPILGSDKVKTKTFHSLPGVPVLPSYKSDLKSGPVSNPGTVPFTWEQSPGRPKNESKYRTLDHTPIIPKLPPGRVPEVKQGNSRVIVCEEGETPSITLSVSSVEENVMKFEEGSESKGSDEEYLDALDTVSGTESYFVNCNVSGLSGLDGPEVKPSGTFSTDAQTKDFMMGRFLPAAKAMTSGTPQYDLWKQPTMQERQRQLGKVISGDKQPPLNHSRPNNILPHCPEYYEEEESADEDEDEDEPGNSSPKLCGLLPKLCLKSSLCLLHPVSGIRVRTRVPMSSVKRNQASFSSVASCQETKNERMSVANHEQNLIGGHQKNEMGEYENVTRNKNNKVRKLEGSSLYRRLLGSDIPTQQNEMPKSRFYEEKCFPGPRKEEQIDKIDSQKRPFNTFRELLADQNTGGKIDSASPMVEKTLFVDSVHKVVSPKFKAVKEIPSKDSLLTNIEKSDILRESNPADCSPGKLDQEMGMEILEDFRHDRDLCKDSIASANVKFPSNGNLDYEDHHHQLMKVRNLQNSQKINSQFLIPPALPKSPSESWLCRTLPSMSTRNSSTHSFLGNKMNSPHYTSRTPSVDPKWETMVKTTKDLVRAPPKN